LVSTLNAPKKLPLPDTLQKLPACGKSFSKRALNLNLQDLFPLTKRTGANNILARLNQLNEIVRINRIDEIIFCAENISSAEIIRAMLELTSLDIDFKIAPPESISIIGSNSIHTAGDLYVVHINAISKPANRRKKKLFDFLPHWYILTFSPVLVWFFSKKGMFLKNSGRFLSEKNRG
jgi:O-antigen biosynthesis protein